jgi:hypothetical protein
MAETNPIPRKTNLFVQVSVAVISGVAATFFIQNFISTPALERTAPPKIQPASEARAPESQRHPDASDAGTEVDKNIPHPPAADSMMVVPETGGAAPGMISIYGEEPAAQAAAPSAAEKAAPNKALAGKKTMPAIHLEHPGSRSVYSGPVVGHAFESDLKPHSFARKEAPLPEVTAKKAAKAQAAAVPLKFYPVLIDKKAIPRKDLFVPSLLHPEIVPETTFWNYERKRKGLISGLITVMGILYLLFAMGIIRVGKPKYQDEDRL